jgi:hypothetical protein
MADPVGLAALIISLIALLATTGQLLQQYFATADGFRRCQPSVMGLWAEKTKLRWRWREFRFETIFAIPRIVYEPVPVDTGKAAEIMVGSDNCSLIDTQESLKRSMIYPGWDSYDARKYYSSDELVCWVPLLAQYVRLHNEFWILVHIMVADSCPRLHSQGRDAVQYFPQKPGSVENDTMVPAIQIIQKSWDFMPTDVVRPMASSTVSDVAIMARRLGMVWKSFDPASGLMRAEGNGHVITSSTVRSLGTVLQYSFTSRKNAANCYYIPVREADKLGFGLVEFDHRLFGPKMPRDLDVGSYQGIASTLPLITSDLIGHSSPTGIGSALQELSRLIKSELDFIPGLNDLVPLCSAMLSVTPSTHKDRWLNQIPAPNSYQKGVTYTGAGILAFEKLLREHIIAKSNLASEQSKEVLSCLKCLQSSCGPRWSNEQDWEHWDYRKGDEQGNEVSAKSMVMQYHTQMTEFLQSSNVDYRHLVGEHALMAICSMSDTPDNKLYQNSVSDIHFFVETTMSYYFKCLPHIAAKVSAKSRRWKPDSTLTAEEVEAAWFSMMFRAFCWQRSHVMISDVPPLSSEYWNSKMPVYIG